MLSDNITDLGSMVIYYKYMIWLLGSMGLIFFGFIGLPNSFEYPASMVQILFIFVGAIGCFLSIVDMVNQLNNKPKLGEISMIDGSES